MNERSAFGLGGGRWAGEEPNAAFFASGGVLEVQIHSGFLRLKERAIDFDGFTNHFGHGPFPGRFLLTR